MSDYRPNCKKWEPIDYLEIDKNLSRFNSYGIIIHFKAGHTLLWKTFFKLYEAKNFAKRMKEFFKVGIKPNLG